jgi:L-ascorbate metabolism protein UlaG (beta-lactamase superfamily)
MRVAAGVRDQVVPASSAAIWWFGPNSHVVECGDCCVMIAPFFSRPGHREKYLLGKAPLRAGQFEPDTVLCTHDHGDHMDPRFSGNSPIRTQTASSWGHQRAWRGWSRPAFL